MVLCNVCSYYQLRPAFLHQETRISVVHFVLYNLCSNVSALIRVQGPELVGI